MVLNIFYGTFAEKRNSMGKIEEWRPVVGYEGLYEVSDWGRVRSLPRKWAKGGMLKPTPNKLGYLQVYLYKNGKKETRKVHILVMLAFVDRCPDGCEVDHIDWNPKNNRLDNLRYIPAKENASRKSPEWQKNVREGAKKRAKDHEWRKNHAEAMRRTKSKPVDQFTIDGQFIKTWPSAREAARVLGYSQGNISTCCNGKQKTAYGHIWRHAENKEAV